MLKKWTKIIAVLALPFLIGCSTSKSLQNGDTFYKGSQIHISKSDSIADWKIENASEKFSTLYLDLWDTPNGAIFGSSFGVFLPTRLYIYNWFYNTNPKGFNNWVRENFGEPPTTIQQVNPELKTQKGQSVFENYGHFGATGHHRLVYNKKKNKAYLHYYFELPRAYVYKDVLISTTSDQALISKHISTLNATTQLKKEQEFNLYKIRDEKKNLATYLNNNGYYFIDKNDFIVLADTTVGHKQVNLEIALADNLPPICYHKQLLLPKSIVIDSIVQTNTAAKKYSWGYGQLKKHMLDTVINMKTNQVYSLANTQKTERDLNSLGIFANPRVIYSISKSDSMHLRPSVKLNMLDATRITFNIRGNYKNTGYVGPSIGFTFRQLNLFGGAENLTVTGDVYYDFPTGVNGHKNSVSTGYSFRNTLSAPLLKTPKNVLKSKYIIPKYFISLNFDYNHRVDYFDLVNWNANYGWMWASNKNLTHKLILVDATYSNVHNTTSRFDDLTASNPFLRESLVNQFILGTAYEINYTRPATVRKKMAISYLGRLDLAGNALNLANSVFTNRPAGEQKFVGVPFSQFARLNSQIVLNWNLTEKSQLVFRNVTGIGFAYGNSYQMPYIKQFFIGGSNSLRPFPIRGVGPGRYLQFDVAEVNQAGDFKLEFNLEYRFTLFWKLKLALFTDAGNIWLLEADPNRPRGEVRWNKLAQDSYLTGGAGIRLETDYIVLRVDLGMVLYWPIFTDGNRWVWQLPSDIVKNSYSPVFAIGYPF